MEGTPFGRYRLQGLIGRGGMGEVWRAFDTETDRVVAIKLLPVQFAQDDEFLERFRREARVAAGLNSPNIVPIHNFGELDGRLYVDMQLIAGKDLQAVLEDGPVSAQRAVRIVEQVASALKVAHAAGLVHRDVKPSNVLLNADDFAYLIDFGLARTDEDAGLTVTGHTVGTYAYMAPERYEGGAVDARTDVYSLACVLFQCLTGRRPFPGTGAQQMLAHVTMAPPRPTDFLPGLPRGFDAVIAKGMAKDVAARYQTIDEFAKAARTVLEDTRTAPHVRGHDIPWPPPQPASGPMPASGWTPHGAPTQFGQQPRSGSQAVPPGPWRPSSTVPDALSYPTVVPRVKVTPWWRRKPVLIAAALLAVIAIAVTSVVIVTTAGTEQQPVADPNITKVGDVSYAKQKTLPSEGLKDIGSIAVTATGKVVGLCCGVLGTEQNGYKGYSQLFNILEDSNEAPTVSPLDGIYSSVTTDDRGGGYLVAPFGGVFKVGEKDELIPLPFPKMHIPGGLAVDASGAVYVVDRNTDGTPESGGKPVTEVWQLPFNATQAVKLPFGDFRGYGLAVDKDGAVYVTDSFAGTILRLDPGTQRPAALPIPDITLGVAVGEDKAVYVAAKSRDKDQEDAVYRFAPGSKEAEKLPITGIGYLNTDYVGIAVDQSGSVLVADLKNNRVVKLPRAEG